MTKKKRMIFMWVAVCFMGITVALLKMCHMGTDPCSAFNYGLARLVGTGLGTCQLSVNLLLLLIVLIYDRKFLGWGTFANMVFVGYIADATTWFVYHVLHVPTVLTLTQRIILMIPTLAVFVVAAAIYMGANLGTAPYDAMVYVIHDLIKKKASFSLKFRPVRMIFDGIFTLGGFVIGGESGVVTVLMVLTLGPAVQKVSQLFGFGE